MTKSFKRIIVVFNPRSSKFVRVRKEVLDPLMGAANPLGESPLTGKLKGVMIGKFEVEPTNVDENAGRLARILEDGDLVVTAGGDGTATIGLNGVVLSKKSVQFAVLPYGNFNDTARLLGCRNIEDVLQGQARKIYPLTAEIDGRVWRRATCYFTLGMLAESTEAFDRPTTRKWLRKGRTGLVFSIWVLFKWWRRKRKKQFLPKATCGKKTDILAVNGKSVARLMKGDAGTAFSSREFIGSEQKLSGFFGVCWFMMRSILHRVPGERVQQIRLDFGQRTKIEIQAEGEYVKREMTTLRIYKEETPVVMVMRKK